ncbi:hypothetical protein [Paraburkholderia sp.]|uniref:hypothetical protein n=1 Tax=Paraburkholderia sp. TaxID=1926495 RepID=UPI002395926D|nr:hypothetical protein [Paraburkholderia sp.]MDE1182414.1 hypothetical protein [Paraburkholderia sp.]
MQSAIRRKPAITGLRGARRLFAIADNCFSTRADAIIGSAANAADTHALRGRQRPHKRIG